MMWDGPRRGPQGGPPFRGDNRGEMFGGRDGPMSDFRGRDGMNMGPRGPQDRGPPMDMRRMDCPPDMRDRDMEPHDIRGRGEPPRDFLGRPGEEPDFSLRRQYEMSIRDKLLNAAAGDVRGRGMGGRGMPPRDLREPNDRFIDMRDRDMFRKDMPGFNNPDMDGRRGGFPMEPMGRNEGFRDMRDRDRPPIDRPPMGMDDIDGFNMDMPPRDRDRDRGMMDFDRRGAPPLNPRKRFESDTDFRNRVGPPAEFRGRDRSPVRFADNDGALMDVRGRPGGPPDLVGPNRPKFVGTDPEGTLRDREFPEMEEVSLAEEWKNRKKEKDSHPSPMTRGLPPFSKEIQGQRFPPVSREGSLLGEPANFKERNMPSTEFPGKKDGPPFDFPRPNREAPRSQNWDKKPPTDIPGMDLPPFGRRSLQDPAFPPMGPGLLPNMPNRENDGKRWPEHGDPKQNQNAPNRVDRPPYLLEKDRPPYILEKTPPTPLGHGPNDKTRFKGPKDALLEQGPGSVKLVPGPDFQGKDQDYRDIDYRTGPGIVFDYKHEELPGPDKVLKESKAVPAPKFSDSGSQDQDYRSASVKDKVTHTICITGIPKTATMEQILGAFAVRDGVPMQGMKIKNVVPGYSYDTAYVEFLNLEDAVHFMESNQGSLKVGTKTALMRYVQPDRIGKEALVSPPTQEPLLPCPGQLLVDKAKNEHHSQDVSQAKTPVDPLSQQGSWQRSSDLTPEAWQQQVDQQLRQQEAEQQAESWASRNPPRQGPGPHQMDPIFKESKTMIIKNVKPTTTVETILKSLDPFAYLDERNVRLVRGKPPGAKCFFVPCLMDVMSGCHDVLLTKPRPLSIDGVRVYAEVAKPLKNQNYRKEFDKSNTSLLGYPPEASMTEVRPLSLVTTETPDMTNYLYDATSGFYYDPQTTLYYDPASRYFYNAQTQEYLYWDSVSKTYIPVPGGHSTDTQPEPTPHFDPPQLLNPTPIMKDMERWAKIQNRQKDSVRVPSPVLKTSGGGLDDRKSSKAADAAFTIFERKGGDDLFKKPMAPPKKEGKGSKQSIGSLGLLASDYAATGSDEEEEVVQHEDPQASRSQSQEKEDKLTDWKKMACLLCRRQFPNKDGLVRHQQLSDLHKQNMEIHMKIKRSKKELEALENQEKESNGSPEQKRRKHQHQNSWVGGSRDMHKGSERPGLGSEPVERKKKESVVWNHATYKQAVRKAMFARFKELD
uniref:C2H2-type domain-containing protein n=1 Tax=Oncorhynchus tshawytscha TaxID=74940 RepID=A0A8C8I0Y9_ONCTS